MRRPVLLALLAALLLGGCGGSSSSKAPGPPSGDPRPAESLSDALHRIEDAASAPTCGPVGDIVHSVYGPVSDSGCRGVLAELGGFRDAHGRTWGTGAAVDFMTTEGEPRRMALAVDGDRRWKVLFIRDGGPTVSRGSPSPLFALTAAAVVRSLQNGDCDTFLRLSDRSTGLAVGADRAVCRRVSDLPFRRELVDNRAARPRALGGSAQLAFFALRTGPGRYYTMVMSQRPPGPRGGGRYVLVTVAPAQ